MHVWHVCMWYLRSANGHGMADKDTELPSLRIITGLHSQEAKSQHCCWLHSATNTWSLRLWQWNSGAAWHCRSGGGWVVQQVMCGLFCDLCDFDGGTCLKYGGMIFFGRVSKLRQIMGKCPLIHVGGGQTMITSPVTGHYPKGIGWLMVVSNHVRSPLVESW